MTDLERLSDEDFVAQVGDFLARQAELRKENQLRFYKPVSPMAEQIHRSNAAVIGVGGGNRASKTESCLVESIALATGVFPIHLDDAFRAKFRGPINVRICVESLTTTLHPVILPKLKWWSWVGVDSPGGEKGHWGWIPRMCLKGGEWDKAWSEKLRMLTLLCRNPDDPAEVLGESTCQFMSYTQDPPDFASGSFHIIHMDEPPPWPIWRENQARVLDVNGRILLSMTWPDDPSIPVDWIYDEVYEKGQPGPLKDPEVDWIEIYTADNAMIDQQSMARKSASWDEQTRNVRLKGQPLRFSNRIHPLFTDIEQFWCFACGKVTGETCDCSAVATEFCHVYEFTIGDTWPAVFLLDPHPRKPHMMLWAAIDPSDDLWVWREGEIDGDAPDVAQYVDDMEESLDVRHRLMDPNMGRTPGQKRDITWQDEFDSAGLACDLAQDSDVGRKRLNHYLKPDPHTGRPRIHVHPRCRTAIAQMKRYVWDDYRRTTDKDIKQAPKAKYDDYPTLLKYLMNFEPSFRLLYAGAPVLRRPGTRKGAY